MHIFVIFLAWAVVSGASAWSSSEVSCASCGSECQKACGTRNFRACCFNFQRRRRSQTPSSYSLKGADETASVDIQRLLRALTERGGYPQESQLPQVLRSFSRSGEEPLTGHALFKDTLQFLSPSSMFLPPLLQDSSEEEQEEEEEEGVEDVEARRSSSNINNVLLPSQGVGEGRSSGLGESGRSVEDVALSRLVALALHHPPPSSPFHQQIRRTRYPPSPSKIIK